MDLRKSHDRSRGFDVFLVCVAVFGWLCAWFGFSRGGAWSILGVLALIGEALMVEGVCFGPKRLTVTRYRMPLVREPKTWVKIAVLSDFHAGSFKKKNWVERVAHETAALKPDLLLLAGDFVTDRFEPVADLSPLAGLAAPLGRFFVLGNHDLEDRPQEIRKTIASYGYEDLTNRSVMLASNGQRFELAAIDDIWFGKPKLLKRSSPSIPHVTLSHEPDLLMNVKEGDTDLIVCGHTHGGQVRLPLIGPLWPIPSKLGRAAYAGKKVMNGVPCIISNGLGESDGRMRLFSPPEIVVVEVGI